MVIQKVWLLSHFHAGTADGKTAYARQFEKPYESLVLVEGSDAPACEVEKQLRVWFVVGTITDRQRSPYWHAGGHRCSSHDSTFADIRTRGVKFGGGHAEHTRGRTAS